MRCGRCNAWMMRLSTDWAHKDWCPLPRLHRREKRTRWRRNKRLRANELARLIAAQAADMRHHQQPTQRTPWGECVLHWESMEGWLL